MKRFLYFLVAVGMILTLAGCLEDIHTPKYDVLSEQYDYYEDSRDSLASGMGITREQADEVFLVLVSCGIDTRISDVSRKAGDDGHCKVSSGIYLFDVYYMDGVVKRVEKDGEELYPNPEPEDPEVKEPEESNAIEQNHEKTYDFDTLQSIFVGITAETTIEDLKSMISEKSLSFTVQEYNKAGGGKEVVLMIAYTDGAALQKYAESGDSIEIAFDKIDNNSLSDNNRIMSAYYTNASSLSALFYNYGTWYDFREETEGDYSGYYIVDHFTKEDGIKIQYDNGNETTTCYFRYNSADEVIRKIIDNMR